MASFYLWSHCFFFMPDNLQDTVHYARQWKEVFSDMYPHGHISWRVKDVATKFTLNRETLAEIMVLSWQGSWSLRRLRHHLAIQRELQNTVHNQQQIFFQSRPSKVNGETDFFKNMSLFLCYIFYCYFLLE